MFTRYASYDSAEVLELKGSTVRRNTASLDKLSDYSDYRTSDGYLYARIRAISSRTNKNHDGWPSVELAGSPEIFDRHTSSTGFTVEAADGNKEFGFATFLGKPVFVDHNNSDPKRARGVIVDAKLNVTPTDNRESSLDPYYSSGDVDPEHLPPTEVELLLEIDANKFPKLAKAVKNGDIDGFSMGCDVERSKCSHCNHIATNPDEYCSHIIMKGATHDYKTADGKRIARKSYENCYGIKFFEISAVFEPADETALAKEVRASVHREGGELFNHEEMPPVQPTGYMECPTCHAQNPHCPNCEGNPMGIIIPGASDEGYKAPSEHDFGPGNVRDPWRQGEPAQGLVEPLERGGYWGPQHQGSVKTAENPLPNSFQTQAPEEVDTLRKEQVCPICGEDMDGDSCDVCGYEAPPQGFGNPDLTKAKDIEQEMQDSDSLTIPNDDSPSNQQPGAPGEPDEGPGDGKMPGSFLQQKTRNPMPTASVIGDMRWEPKLHPRVAGRINQHEKPIKTTAPPATNEPVKTTVTNDQTKPVTAAMLTAQNLIQTAQRNHTGETMSTRTADGPTPPDAAPDKRVDVEGVGGVIEPSNDAASKADAQVDVGGVGGVGVTEGVEADQKQTLPTAGEGSDDAGFNKDKTTEDSGPTRTYPDSDGTEKGFTDPVTQETPYWVDESKWSAQRQAGDPKPFPDDSIGGGSANKGTEPVDAIGKAGERVDVLSPATTPENNSGPTKTWTGTDGNKIYRQQDPVTRELQKNNTDDAWTSHFIAALKVVDAEVELGVTSKDDKLNRLSELVSQTDEVIGNTEETLSRVRTAGLKRLAEARTAGVRSLPSLFGQKTAAPEGAFGRTFERVASGSETEESEVLDETVLDAGLFSR